MMFGAIDPLYQIDFGEMIKSTKSKDSIKAFSSVINGMNNNNFSFLTDDIEDSMFGMSYNPDIYKSLYGYNKTYQTSNMYNILNNNTTETTSSIFDKTLDEYKNKLNDAIKNLYNDSKLNINNNEIDLLNLINGKSYSNEILFNDGRIKNLDNIDNENPILIFEDNDLNKKLISINNINLDKADRLELISFISYYTMDNNNMFSNKISDIINLSNEDFEENKESLIKFAKELKEYKTSQKEFEKAKKISDKEKDENEKIEALFDLIDAINEMYQKYSESERKNIDKKKRKY